MKTKTIKSPPLKNLEDCINYTKTLYNTFSHSSFEKSEIASSLGFSATSGGFSLVLSSLRSFGLIVINSKGFIVSDNFKKLNANINYNKILNEFIYNVPLYNELLNDYKNKIPDRTILIQRLEIQKKFSPNWAHLIVKTFEESLRFAGVLDSNHNVLPYREENKNNISETLINNVQNDETIDTDSHEKLNKSIKNEYLKLEISLKNDRMVEIRYPRDFNKEDGIKVCKFIESLTM
ncbi:MAG TPA: hypothetical protein PLG90_08250 [Ignavibacteria bacterium]|nr:hypothetical protein [Ignavibacteria bacterium]